MEMYNIAVRDHPDPRRLFIDPAIDTAVLERLIPYSTLVNAASTKALWDKILAQKGAHHDRNGSTTQIPVGPLHVALEEPMYFRVDVDGETVRDVDINAGHVHRGIEYLITKRTIFQNVVLTERICSLCSNSHPQAFVMAIEQIAGIEIPERAAYLRVIADEIKRIASHLFNVGILAHLIGFDTLFMHVMQVREIMQDVKETVFGNRMDIGANVIGGVRYDIDAETHGLSDGRTRQAHAGGRRARRDLPQQQLDPAAHQGRRRADAERGARLRRGRAGRARLRHRLRRARQGALRGLRPPRSARAHAARRRRVVAGDDPALPRWARPST